MITSPVSTSPAEYCVTGDPFLATEKVYGGSEVCADPE